MVESGVVTAVIFHPNGQFRMVSCNGALGRDTIYQHVTTSSVHAGTWRRLGEDRIKLKYKKCVAFLFTSKRAARGKFRFIIPNPSTTAVLKLGDTEYVKGDYLSFADKRKMIRYAETPRREIKKDEKLLR